MLTTRIDEIAAGIYRINTGVPPSLVPGGFSFNQYLVVGDEALLFHTGGRSIFQNVKSAIEKVLPINKLRYVGFSHHESDENGSINEFLGAVPGATAVCSRIMARINRDVTDRPARVLKDGEKLDLGNGRVLEWLDTPHLPHGWESGLFHDSTSRTLFCGDLFTQPGTGEKALTQADILGPSEEMRLRNLDYYSYSPATAAQMQRLAALQPGTLACMHGHAWEGNGQKLLGELGAALARENK